MTNKIILSILYLHITFLGAYSQSVYEKIKSSYDNLDTLEYNRLIYNAIIDCSYIIDSSLAKWCNEKVGTITGANYDMYLSAEKSYDHKMYLLRVAIDSLEYKSTGKVSLIINSSPYPFNIFYIKDDAVHYYLYTNDDGIETVSHLTKKWVVPYYPDPFYTRKDRYALNKILALQPDFVLYSTYFWEAYLFVKNQSIYVFNVKLYKAFPLEEYLSNCCIKYGFIFYGSVHR